MESSFNNLFNSYITFDENFISIINSNSLHDLNQSQTKDIFSEKWTQVAEYEDVNIFYDFQRDWFLQLYGFGDEESLKNFLLTKNTILDTGCGLGYKAAWFAKLAPHAIVIGIDISDSIHFASRNFKSIENLYFIKGNIANTRLKNGVIDFTVCDQVIMHTEVPEETFRHLAEITSDKGELACYVYSKKSLPRELIDDYFRNATHTIKKEKMWEFSEQLTELGKRLSELKVSFDCPDIPLLGIKGGNYDIQRFIYWNFLKCFWKEEWGFDLNKSTNFDWYAPSNAKRFSNDEFIRMAEGAGMKPVFMHIEEACYSGRFCKSFS